MNRRPVRSFVRREGRISHAQTRSLTTLLPQYALSVPETGPITFGRTGVKKYLEIGFGSGENLLAEARLHKDIDYLGAEVHGPGVGKVLNAIHQAQYTHVTLAMADILPLLSRMPKGYLSYIWVLFPDPWPKKKHHKRRIIQANTVQEFARVLQPGGVLHIATDWHPYVNHIKEVMAASAAFRLRSPALECPRNHRPLTKFEWRGIKLGHAIQDLIYLAC